MIDTTTRKRLQALEAALARSLELLDAGRTDEAREELARLSAPELSDSELEAAFQSAEPETEHMLDADRVAEVALRQAGADEPHVEGEGEGAEDRRDGAAGLVAEVEDLPPSFATVTMAELLEDQGDTEGASRIRASLARPGRGAAVQDLPRRPSRKWVVDTLEYWLENMRGARG